MLQLQTVFAEIRSTVVQWQGKRRVDLCMAAGPDQLTGPAT